ncbi:hypothetical protein D3C81_2171870 [compost metagenome]
MMLHKEIQRTLLVGTKLRPLGLSWIALLKRGLKILPTLVIMLLDHGDLKKLRSC